jgi:hypothetical protein
MKKRLLSMFLAAVMAVTTVHPVKANDGSEKICRWLSHVLSKASDGDLISIFMYTSFRPTYFVDYLDKAAMLAILEENNSEEAEEGIKWLNENMHEMLESFEETKESFIGKGIIWRDERCWVVCHCHEDIGFAMCWFAKGVKQSMPWELRNFFELHEGRMRVVEFLELHNIDPEREGVIVWGNGMVSMRATPAEIMYFAGLDEMVSISYSGTGFRRIGHVLGNDRVGVADALEILRYLVGLPNVIDDCIFARDASLIVIEAKGGAPAMITLPYAMHWKFCVS